MDCFRFTALAQAESGGKPDILTAVHQTWSRPAVRLTALAVQLDHDKESAVNSINLIGAPRWLSRLHLRG